MSDVLFIVMPAYNEEEALPEVLDGWYPFVESNPRNRFIVVDDGSCDSTRSVLENYASTHKQLVVLSVKNGGHGAAIYQGYQLALKGSDMCGGIVPDYIFQTDSDGQTLPSEFPLLWNHRRDYDAVMGNRSKRQDGFSRVVVTKNLKLIVAATMHAHVADANVPFRLMSREALEECLRLVPVKHNLTNVVLSAAFYTTGKRMLFVPITFSKREQGTNSINLKSIAGIGVRALRDFRVIGKNLARYSSERKQHDYRQEGPAYTWRELSTRV